MDNKNLERYLKSIKSLNTKCQELDKEFTKFLLQSDVNLDIGYRTIFSHLTSALVHLSNNLHSLEKDVQFEQEFYTKNEFHTITKKDIVEDKKFPIQEIMKIMDLYSSKQKEKENEDLIDDLKEEINEGVQWIEGIFNLRNISKEKIKMTLYFLDKKDSPVEFIKNPENEKEEIDYYQEKLSNDVIVPTVTFTKNELVKIYKYKKHKDLTQKNRSASNKKTKDDEEMELE